MQIVKLIFIVFVLCPKAIFGQADTVLLDSIRQYIVEIGSDTAHILTTYYAYDTRNQLVEEYSVSGLTGQNKDRTTFSYSSDQDTTIDFEADENRWIPTFRDILFKSIDNFGSTVLQKDIWSEDQGRWFGDIRFSNYLNEAGFEEKRIRENYDEDSMQWDTNSIDCYFFDDQDRQLTYEGFFRSFSGEEIRSRNVRTYDPVTGLLTADTSYRLVANQQEQLSRRSSFFYNEEGLRTLTIVFSYDTLNGAWDSLERYISEYNEMNLSTRFLIEDYDGISKEWIPSSETIREFSADGILLLNGFFNKDFVTGDFSELFRSKWTLNENNLYNTLKIYQRNSARVLVPLRLETYTYNSWDLLATEKTERYLDEDSFEPSYALKKYYYSDGTTTNVKELIDQKPYRVGPNPTTDYIQLNGTNSEPLQYEIYDFTGRLVVSAAISDSQLIHIPSQAGQTVIIILRNKQGQVVQREQIIRGY